jgi:hypothetical protein
MKRVLFLLKQMGILQGGRTRQGTAITPAGKQFYAYLGRSGS